MLATDRRSAPLWLLAFVLGACSGAPPVPSMTGVGEQKTAMTQAAADRSVAEIESLIASGADDQALEKITATLDEWPPEATRQRLQRLAFEIRRDRFYRQHPLTLSLALDQPRYAFGGKVHVAVKVTNLGPDALTMPVEYRSTWDALMLRAPEKSALQLRVVAKDADGAGNLWTDEALYEVPLEEDLELAPGASRTIEHDLPLVGGDRALTRFLRISAIYRPIAIVAADGSRRYDPFEFPAAEARVFRPEHLRAAAGGLALVAQGIAGEPSLRAEALFSAAAGLEPPELREGIDRLARAAPGLDAGRRRTALAALRLLSPHETANDPVRFLGWWDSAGKLQTDDEILARAGLAPDRLAVAIGAGARN